MELVERGSDVHVIPIADLRDHDETRACWCVPAVIVELYGDVVVHHAADGRELVEAHGVN